MLEQYVKKILTSRVYDVAVETPLQTARQLSERLGNSIWLKREDLQPVFSFKIRGAYNKLTQLSDEERARNPRSRSAKLRAAERTDAPARDDTPDLLPRLPALADVLKGR